ncbi:MAG: UDP-N-acetylmuramoyl-tripeptide--D-alanyl-D-alanine ligase [Betaproteobacteria bacterium]|nr:UDP-N-acetylmuramoyl-tripeptide--D-alanyl-D-alanine ligase [Betaproteobacteria bacterium]
MMGLGEAAQAIGAQAVGMQVRFRGVSTDTRSMDEGELFVAIRGEKYDGHAFLDAARQRGAAAAMVDRAHGAVAPLPLLVVEDTRRGLGRLGAHWRARFRPVLIAVAGSNGKTTTKEMLASILRAHAGEARVLATAGNLNTDIGVPKTLLRMTAAHSHCAIELGMNHPGEIAYLAAIARPTIAVVTNAQREHQEFMKTVAAAAEENASVFASLPSEGVAVINGDDEQAHIFRRARGARRTVEFKLEGKAEVTATHALGPLSSAVLIHTPSGDARARIAIPGLHNVRNALAAAACGFAAGASPAAIGEGLQAFRPYSGRHQVKVLESGATLIDDSYNANPDSVRAAIDVLAQLPGPTLLILGDMGEVGDSGPEYHREVGAYARQMGISRLLGTGDATRETVRAFGQGANHVEKVEDLAPQAAGAKSLLVKGSRFMRMERVVSALTDEKAGGH